MPEVSSVQRSDVRAAIARASAATGVNFDYLLAQAKIESAFDPSARASTSSAAGLFQFTAGTWLETLDRHGARHGLSWADAAISRSGGRAGIDDPTMRAQVMNLRFDPDASALMAAELARDNATELRGVLGREPDSAELYLAHFMGAGGARSFLTALQNNPGQSAADLFPESASANRPIFYDNGRPRSVGEVMDLMRNKVSSAMEGGFDGFSGGRYYSPQSSFQAASYSRSAAPEQPQRIPSMADTLQATFGSTANLPGKAGERVEKAYSAFRTFGL
ncbi:lytic transglycosylase domain-containing protein [Croceibacterium selenioxidans]|uniref:lytic transglycosylase domain-containing protein n=1 Tax=Croceibacterium selenioxidans TaxID=2838833 RepID=UPI0030845E9F